MSIGKEKHGIQVSGGRSVQYIHCAGSVLCRPTGHLGEGVSFLLDFGGLPASFSFLSLFLSKYAKCGPLTAGSLATSPKSFISHITSCRSCFVIHSLHHPFALVRHPPQRHSAQNQILQLLPLILVPHPHPIDTQPLHPSSIDLPISLGTSASTTTTTIQLVDLLYTCHICHFS